MLAADNGARWALTKPELSMLARVASRDPKRPNLSAVVFDPGRRWVHACDGHRALVAVVDGEQSGQPGAPPGGRDGPDPVLVPSATVQGAIAAARARDAIVFTIGGDGPATWKVYTPPGRAWDHADQAVNIDRIAAEGTAGAGGGWTPPPIQPAPIHTVLPDYDRKAPKKPAPCVALNPKYVAEVHDLAKIQPDRTVPIRVWHADALDPILLILDTDHGVTWRMVVMPMRQ